MVIQVSGVRFSPVGADLLRQKSVHETEGEVPDGPSSAERISEAQRLVDELDWVLSRCACDSDSLKLIRLRLARAYVLGLRDELSRLGTD